MKFRVEHSALKTTIPALARVAKRAVRVTPVLDYILLRASGASVTATSTDLETAILFTMPAQVEVEGAALVKAEKLSQIVSVIQPGPIEFDTDQESWRAKISIESTDYNLAGLCPDEYPDVNLECDEWITIEANTLTAAIDAVAFAASDDDSRFHLNGVYIEPAPTGAVFVATDGHRLAWHPTSLKLGEAALLVPSKAITELRKILDGMGGEIQVGKADKLLLISTDTSRMSVRCLDGNYPDYRKVIPSECKQTATIERSELVAALKRVAVLSTDRNKGITMNVTPTNIEIQAIHPDVGTARDAIGCVVNEGNDGWNAIINVYYLQEALNAFDAEKIKIEWSCDGAPIVLRAPDAGKYFNLVMPMRK